MENYINDITFQTKITNKITIKLQIKEIIVLACRKFTNLRWKFTLPIIMGLKITHYNRYNFIQNFFTVQIQTK